MENTIMKTIKEKNINVSQLARDIGCERSTIYQAARGKTELKLHHALNLASALGVSVENLFQTDNN